MTRCRASFERAAEFVFAAAHAPDASVNHQLQALFGTSLAEKAGAPLAAARVGEMAGELRGRLDHAYDAGGFDPFAHDAKLLLLCHGIMRSRGAESRALASFTRETSATLRDVGTVPIGLTGLAHLLTAMGEGPFRTSRAGDGGSFPSVRSLLLAENGVLRQLCNTVAGATLFGARKAPGTDPGLLLALPVLLLQKLSEYDLILGTTLLRTLAYLDVPDPEAVDWATRYLESQQQSDGRFGYYARELAEGPELRTVDQNLHLPVTVSVLWALAETSVPGFQLVDRV